MVRFRVRVGLMDAKIELYGWRIGKLGKKLVGLALCSPFVGHFY